MVGQGGGDAGEPRQTETGKAISRRIPIIKNRRRSIALTVLVVDGASVIQLWGSPFTFWNVDSIGVDIGCEFCIPTRSRTGPMY